MYITWHGIQVHLVHGVYLPTHSKKRGSWFYTFTYYLGKSIHVQPTIFQIRLNTPPVMDQQVRKDVQEVRIKG